jgi:PDZ domain-containing protein
MSRRAATLGISLGLAAVLAIGGSRLPVPYVVLAPGPVRNTVGMHDDKQLIVVPADRDHPVTAGELDLTTVNVFPKLTLGEAIVKWLDGKYAVVPRDLIYPPGQTEQQSTAENEKEMEESQQHAITAALCELGTPVTARVLVDGVTGGSPADKAGMKKGDVIIEIDGRPVDSVCTLRRLVALDRPGAVVSVTLRRGGEEHPVQVHTNTKDVGADGRPLLGIELAEQDPHKPFPVSIEIDDIGGPSAGLMFALGIYDRLTPGNLTGGKIIAGTGTIDDDGSVGAIGGIGQKLIAARDHGAHFFLTPVGNYDEASKVTPKGLTLVKVASLRQALDAVRAIAEGRAP